MESIIEIIGSYNAKSVLRDTQNYASEARKQHPQMSQRDAEAIAFFVCKQECFFSSTSDDSSETSLFEPDSCLSTVDLPLDEFFTDVDNFFRQNKPPEPASHRDMYISFLFSAIRSLPPCLLTSFPTASLLDTHEDVVWNSFTIVKNSKKALPEGCAVITGFISAYDISAFYPHTPPNSVFIFEPGTSFAYDNINKVYRAKKTPLMMIKEIPRTYKLPHTEAEVKKMSVPELTRYVRFSQECETNRCAVDILCSKVSLLSASDISLMADVCMQLTDTCSRHNVQLAVLDNLCWMFRSDKDKAIQDLLERISGSDFVPFKEKIVAHTDKNIDKMLDQGVKRILGLIDVTFSPQIASRFFSLFMICLAGVSNPLRLLKCCDISRIIEAAFSKFIDNMPVLHMILTTMNFLFAHGHLNSQNESSVPKQFIHVDSLENVFKLWVKMPFNRDISTKILLFSHQVPRKAVDKAFLNKDGTLFLVRCLEEFRSDKGTTINSVMNLLSIAMEQRNMNFIFETKLVDILLDIIQKDSGIIENRAYETLCQLAKLPEFISATRKKNIVPLLVRCAFGQGETKYDVGGAKCSVLAIIETISRKDMRAIYIDMAFESALKSVLNRDIFGTESFCIIASILRNISLSPEHVDRMNASGLLAQIVDLVTTSRIMQSSSALFEFFQIIMFDEQYWNLLNRMKIIRFFSQVLCANVSDPCISSFCLKIVSRLRGADEETVKNLLSYMMINTGVSDVRYWGECMCNVFFNGNRDGRRKLLEANAAEILPLAFRNPVKGGCESLIRFAFLVFDAKESILADILNVHPNFMRNMWKEVDPKTLSSGVLLTVKGFLSKPGRESFMKGCQKTIDEIRKITAN